VFFLFILRYGHHDHALSSTSGYFNHSWEDVRLGERVKDGDGVRSLGESREQYVSLAPYNYDNHHGGLENPPSDHVLPADASIKLQFSHPPSNRNGLPFACSNDRGRSQQDEYRCR
jgi:hypothetical protein